MKLVLIEGPAKRDTIKKYLGADYEVFATKGHIRDLPVSRMGVDIEHNFEPTYEILSDKKEIVNQLKEKAKRADQIFLATDPDREGEAISWHLANILGLDFNSKVRVAFNELSKKAVTEGLANPRTLNMNLIDAQQARRVLDRLMGYKLSPLLSKKIKSKLSAGRVQSVTLKLIVDQEKKIRNFVKEEYWTLTALLKKAKTNAEFESSLYGYNGKKIEVKNKEQMDKIVSQINGSKFEVKDVKKSVVFSKAPAPYITSTLQQDAVNKLKMTLKSYTKCAQDLYEGIEIANEGKIALVTYIRTDSTRVAVAAQYMAKDFIMANFGDKYVPAKFNEYKAKKSAQDAHEAIRPISLEYTPQNLKGKIDETHLKLYTLVFNRFLASQMTDAQYDALAVELFANNYNFKSTGRTVKFDGFTRVYKHYTEDESKSSNIPPLEVGELLDLISLNPEQKFTKPPQRFTEATLVKEMEDKGIGRPATYAATVMTLLNREYVEKQVKALVPTELGEKVTEFLENFFENLMNVKFTAQMEQKLDEIELGGKNWKEIINEFYGDFNQQLNNAYEKSAGIKKEVQVSDVVCDKCGALMVYRESKYGKFLACPNFPKCKNTKSLEKKPDQQNSEKGFCPLCHHTVSAKFSKKGKLFYGCDNYPNCKFMSWNLPLAEYCPKCGKELYKKTGAKKTTIYCEDKSCGYIKPE